MSEEHIHARAEAEAQPEGDEQTLLDAGFSKKQLADRRSALSQIRQFGDPVLRSEAREISGFDEGIRAQAERMIELMDEAFGVGLAAPQIGVSNRLLVYRVGEAPPVVLANPQIEWSSEDQEGFQEGCLSLANVQVDVDRAIHVRVSGQNQHGEQILIEASGLNARVIQHEMDHLDGVLIIDRASKDQRREALRGLREAEDRAGYAA